MSDSRPAVRLPFSRGLAWIVASVSLLRLQFGRLLLIAVFMQLILSLTRLPVIGLLIILSVPALTAGILEALHVTARGGMPRLALMFHPLLTGSHTGRLLGMGGLVFVVGVLSISLMLSGSSEMLDPEVLSRIEQGDMDAIASLDQAVLGRMLLAFMVGIAVSGTLSYFSIPLIWFGDRKLGEALALGLRKLFEQWRPFLVLGLGVVAMLLPIAVVAAALVSLAAAGGLLSMIIMGFVMLLLLAFQMVLFGTQYCAYRDIFGIGEEPGEPGEDEGQLLA